MRIVECLGILTIQVIKEEDHNEDTMMMKNLMVKGNHLYVTSVVIMDVFQGIVEHFKVINMELVREGIHLYVIYVITLYTQQDFVEWTEGTTIGMIEGMKMEATKIRKK